MKSFKFALLAAGALALTACSSDDAPEINDNNTGEPSGYIKVDIKLPTNSGTRAVVTEYEQGTPQEYAVSNGRLIVFKKGKTEGEATMVCVAPLTGMNFGAGQDGEITTSSSSVSQLYNISLTDASAYAGVVVLNYSDSFVFPVSGETFASWSQKPQTDGMILKADGKEFLTMTNAARYQENAQPTVLVDLDKSKIAQTEAGATTPAGTFHVQRATAKVSVVTNDQYNPKSESYKNDIVKITGWALDVTNKTTYPVQVTEGLNNPFTGIWAADRFFGGAKFPRFFWAKDPNYSDDIATLDAVKGSFNVIGAVSGNPAALYCLENTFDIEHQKQGQTTRVVFKGTYKPAGIAEGENFLRIGSNTTLWSVDNAKAQILAKAQTALNTTGVSVEMGNAATAAGFHSLKEVTINKGNTRISDTEYDAVAKLLGLADANDAGIATYVEGAVYYISRIKHFGDEDCSWKIGDPTYGENNEENNRKYLGRYGMLRNFWYEVKVNSISTLGSPVIPEIKPDVPDDENEYYIRTEINILAWAKRVLNTDL